MSSTRSLFIPRVFINISKERIAKIFDTLDLGIVDKIDFVRKQGHAGPYNAVYVHLKYWLKTSASRTFRDKLIENKDGVKLVYEDPWFWVVLPNTAEKKKAPPASRPPKLTRSAKIYPEVHAVRINSTAPIELVASDTDPNPKTPDNSPPSSPRLPDAPKKDLNIPTLENMVENLHMAEELLATLRPPVNPYMEKLRKIAASKKNAASASASTSASDSD